MIASARHAVPTLMVCPPCRTTARRHLAALGTLALLVSLVPDQPALAQTPGTDNDAAARALFERADAALDRKDYATACPMLEEVIRLVPNGIGAHMALGECYEGSGRIASAWTVYSRAEEIARRDQQRARIKEARRHIDALAPRLAHLTIKVAEGPNQPTDLTIQRDDIPVGRAQWNFPLPVDKGKHVILASAPRRQRVEKTIDIANDGDNVSVSIGWPDEPEPPPTPSPAKPQSPASPPPPPVSLSHHLQVGVSARVDIDPLHPGARALPGLTLGLGSHFELGASAILGRDMGVEPQVAVFVLSGALKPFVTIASPIFLTGGVHVGARAGAGLQWDINRHFGLFLGIGGAYFFSVPMGYSNLVLLPSAGVQARL